MAGELLSAGPGLGYTLKYASRLWPNGHGYGRHGCDWSHWGNG